MSELKAKGTGSSHWCVKDLAVVVEFATAEISYVRSRACWLICLEMWLKALDWRVRKWKLSWFPPAKVGHWFPAYIVRTTHVYEVNVIYDFSHNIAQANENTANSSQTSCFSSCLRRGDIKKNTMILSCSQGLTFFDGTTNKKHDSNQWEYKEKEVAANRKADRKNNIKMIAKNTKTKKTQDNQSNKDSIGSFIGRVHTRCTLRSWKQLWPSNGKICPTYFHCMDKCIQKLLRVFA